MEHQFASHCAHFMRKHQIIQEKEIAVYTYGFEVMFSSLVSVLLISVLSLLFRAPSAWIIFLIGFVPGRVTAGGYHASTQLRCHMIFSTAFVGLLLVRGYQNFTPMFAVVTAIIELIAILCLSPIEAINKPLKQKVKLANRKRSIFFALFDLALAVLLGLHYVGWTDFMVIYYLSKWVMMIFMLLGCFEYMFCNKQNM